MQEAQADPARDALTQSRAARQAGDNAAALHHIETAIALSDAPAPMLLDLERANILYDLGRKSEALDRLAALAEASPEDPLPHRRLAWLSHLTGDHDTALYHQKRAIALDTGTVPVSMHQIHANILYALGREDEALEKLAELTRSHPEDPGPHRRLAFLLRQRGADLSVALHHARTAMRLAPDDHATKGLVVDLLLDLDQEDAADRMLADWGRDGGGPPVSVAMRRVTAALKRGRSDDALASVTRFGAQFPDDTGICLVRAQVTARVDGPAAAAKVLEDFTGSPLTPEMHAHLIGYHKAAGNFGVLDSVIKRAIDACPAEPVVLLTLFRHFIEVADGKVIETILDRLRPLISRDDLRRLDVTYLLDGKDFRSALEQLYPRPGRRRSPEEADALAQALVGTHRYAVAMRYLRACVRRFPAHTYFLIRLAGLCLRLGRFDALEAELTALKDRHPDLDQQILLQSYALALHKGDLEAAIRHSARIRSEIDATKGDPAELIRLLVYQQSPERAQSILEMIEKASPRHLRPHAGGTLNGQLKIEYLLDTGSAEEDIEALRAKVRARPGLTPRALRLIDRWISSEAPEKTGSTGQPIPQRIVQYWHMANPPKQVADIIRSWAGLPGFEHRLYDRASARAFMRELGPFWLKAFLLANNPAEEADFLRLCLLAKEGGIWADADDYLYGSLQGLVRNRRGLVIYREAFGGAIGNNFIAASAQHPVLLHAARLARRALLQRAAETTWLKTGPGLLSVAVAHHLSGPEAEHAADGLTILDYATVANEISMHNSLPYKRMPSHWTRNAALTSDLWVYLAERLAQTGDREAEPLALP